jgi:hydroxyethylthiazole kinase-like uncharacterized protein yjeF
MATLPGGTLVQRAAAGLAAACVDFLGGAYGRRVLVLAGSGDNAGDGLHAGALLARRGARVEALPVGETTHQEGLAALRRAGGGVTDEVGAADLVLDAIVGIGGRGGLRGSAQRLVDEVMARDMPVVAVDVPSGIGVDTGEVDGSHVDAEFTVTFGTDKIGLLVGPAAQSAGAVYLVDIGVQPYLGDPAVTALQPADVAARLTPPRAADHKYTRGVVGVAAGSARYAGAGLLAAAGASCGLAGMVRYLGAAEVADLIRARHPEVVVGDGRVRAWVVGSGGGDDTKAMLRRALADDVPVVADAEALRHLPERLPGSVVLTPHAGELAELLGVERAEVERRPLHFVRAAVDRFTVTVLLKGDRTLIASPGHAVAVNPTGNPWLATAGAGDVLAGLIGALAAAGATPYDAAQVAAWLHGAAATWASRGGPVVAESVAAAIPEVVRHLLAGTLDADER